MEQLLKEGATVCAYDPEAIPNIRGEFGDRISYGESAYKAIEGADALLIVTEWNEFRTPDFKKIKQLLKEPVIFDGRNLYDIDKMQDTGFIYYSIGRTTIQP
jgi:UDPglucose 6-dehydrogenase